MINWAIKQKNTKKEYFKILTFIDNERTEVLALCSYTRKFIFEYSVQITLFWTCFNFICTFNSLMWFTRAFVVMWQLRKFLSSAKLQFSPSLNTIGSFSSVTDRQKERKAEWKRRNWPHNRTWYLTKSIPKRMKFKVNINPLMPVFFPSVCLWGAWLAHTRQQIKYTAASNWVQGLVHLKSLGPEVIQKEVPKLMNWLDPINCLRCYSSMTAVQWLIWVKE